MRRCYHDIKNPCGIVRVMHDPLLDFGQFLWNVIFQWSNLMTGGVIVAGIVVYKVITKKDISRKANIFFAVLFVFLATFLAWKEEYERSHPNLAVMLTPTANREEQWKRKSQARTFPLGCAMGVEIQQSWAAR
jgi:hypothetical protein